MAPTSNNHSSSGDRDDDPPEATITRSQQAQQSVSEPDYRFTLANERTYLAWFRTSVALIAGGVAVVQLVPEFAFSGARHGLGVLLTVGGGVLSLAALRRWQLVQTAMRRAEALPPTRIPAVLGVLLAALTVLLVILLLLSGHQP